jgi:nucleoside-diphosphate-sugar epimerase
MKNSISILGCGWLGAELATELVYAGFQVYGSTTTSSKLNTLKQKGVTPFLIDIIDDNLNISKFLSTDILIIAITSKNITAIINLISKIENSKVSKVLFVSSTSVYPNTNGIVTEQTETNNTILAKIEDLFLSNRNFKTTIVRFGGLFGYDRNPGNFFKNGKIIDNPEGFINFIHRDDCIQIIKQIILKNTWNNIFNACSNSHPTRREFYTNEFRKLGRKSIVFNENADNHFKIVNSQKLEDTLGYRFIFNNLMQDKDN